MGFTLAQASEALLQCEGDLSRSVDLLTYSQSSASKNHEQESSKSKKGKKKKKKQQKQVVGKSDHRSEDDRESGDDKNNKDVADKSVSCTTTTTTATKQLASSFKEQRKQEMRFKKALRDRKKTCRVCGGPHPRNECPGIADDGRGHSRYSDKNTRAKESKQRKQWLAQQEHDGAFLEQGHWTATTPYMDGFANLVACYNNNNSKNDQQGGEQAYSSQNTAAISNRCAPSVSLSDWILQWSNRRSVILGDEHTVGITNRDQRKIELKTWAGSKLRATCHELLGQEAVEIALKHRQDPRSEMIRIILNREYQEDDTNQETNESNADAKSNQRTLSKEWPGYHGAIVPLSVLDEGQKSVLEQLALQYSVNPLDHDGVHVLLSVAPHDVSKWMTFVKDDEISVPVDLDFLIRAQSEIQDTQVQLKKATDYLLAAKKKQRAAAEAQVAKLRQTVAHQKGRLDEFKEILRDDAVADQSGGAAAPSLDPNLGDLFQRALNSYKEHPLVVGVSCGLNYDTPGAQHAQFGPAIRQAQRDACTRAIQAAVKAGLTLVLECNDSSEVEGLSDTKTATQTASIGKDEKSANSLASADLVRILAQHAPSNVTMVLRNGSLTMAPKPGIAALLQTWPSLYVGLSAKLAFSKCPQSLLNATFDLPMDKILLTSEAPLCLPPALSGSPHLVESCLPPHVACVAETVAAIKKGLTRREAVLEASTKNVCRAFGLPPSF